MDELERQNFLELQSRVASAQKDNALLQQASTLFSSDEHENLIKFQLDPKEALLRIERLIRRQIPARDKEGNTYYKDVPKEDQIFNENGINAIMSQLAIYVNKEILLSNYTIDEVNKILLEFSYKITDFIYINAEEFGMNTPSKKKYYTSICMDITNLVDAVYHRSIGGKELDSLKTARIVNQSGTLGNQMPMMNSQKKSFNVLKPSTWI
jgi:hypothetical protein